jgi:hypothetical protein
VLTLLAILGSVSSGGGGGGGFCCLFFLFLFVVLALFSCFSACPVFESHQHPFVFDTLPPESLTLCKALHLKFRLLPLEGWNLRRFYQRHAPFVTELQFSQMIFVIF